MKTTYICLICEPTFADLDLQPFQAEIYYCHLYPLQATNLCRNSRLVVDENDLEVGGKWKNIFLLLKQFHDNLRSKIPAF